MTFDMLDARLERARGGDNEALSEILAEQTPKLVRMVELRMSSQHRRRLGPEDIVQEALVDATRRFGEWCSQDRYPFRVWMRLLTTQALARSFRQHHQAQKRDADRDRELTPQRASVSAESVTDWLVSTGTSPTQAARRTEVRERVLAAVAELEELDREILALRHFEQLSNEDAAMELGIEPAAASKRFARALERLRPVLRVLKPDESASAP